MNHINCISHVVRLEVGMIHDETLYHVNQKVHSSRF